MGEEDIQENIGGVNFIMEKYLFDTVGRVEIRWNGYGYSIYADGVGASSC
ncbi:hypothetical protein KHM83_13955 [Fusibacter paucivorans]|uniref:Uncharacterized protein n=1 Tax=Fusibacter paucivorans TaxID=76009 RepID=A0ABS5PRJ3_9FIRM|nr:hypothetical protein [Fusibacter paucivorans]MBS7527784.1 hypothetical protein [Fusibacter paucivorans]